MAEVLGRRAWREIVRPGGTHPLLPGLLLVAVVAATALAAIALPQPVAGPAALTVAVATLCAAYLVWPKPALLTFALVMLLSRSLSRWFQPELTHLDELVVPALVVLAAARTRPWQHRRWFQPMREAGLALFLAAGVTSALLAGTPSAVWVLGLVLTLKLFAFFYVVLWHDFSVTDVRQLPPVVLALAVIVLAVGGLEAIDPLAVREALNLGEIGLTRESLPSIKSLLWHPGSFAWFASFIAVFMFAGHVVLGRWWLLIGGFLFSLGTVLAARRRAIVALVFSLASGIAATLGKGSIERRSVSSWLRVGLAVAIIALVFLPALLSLIDRSVDEVADSGTARIELYDASLRIAADHFPLGVGFGRFGSAPSKDPYSPVYAEYGLDAVRGLGPGNPAFVGDAYWAGILGETGVAGLAGLAVFVAALAAGAWRAARTSYAAPLIAAYALGAWMALVHTLIETLASSMFDSPPRTYLFFGSVAVALALGRDATREPEQP